MSRRAAIERALAGSTGNGEERRAQCPLCEERTGKPDRHGALAINAKSGAYICYKCGLAGYLWGNAPARSSSRAEQVEAALAPEMRLPDGFEPMFDRYSASPMTLRPALDYLRGRGLSGEVIADARVGACVDGYCSGRIVVPIYAPSWSRPEVRSSLVGWVARDWTGNQQPKYRYPTGMLRGEMLYSHEALSRPGDAPVFVVEGVLDALALWKDAVAVLGKPTAWQVDQLVRANRPVVVVLDGDAWREGWALAQVLRIRGQRAGSVRLPPRTDPDEVPRDWLDEEARRCLG